MSPHKTLYISLFLANFGRGFSSWIPFWSWEFAKKPITPKIQLKIENFTFSESLTNPQHDCLRIIYLSVVFFVGKYNFLLFITPLTGLVKYAQVMPHMHLHMHKSWHILWHNCFGIGACVLSFECVRLTRHSNGLWSRVAGVVDQITCDLDIGCWLCCLKGEEGWTRCVPPSSYGIDTYASPLVIPLAYPIQTIMHV